jgi:hypothetical protein
METENSPPLPEKSPMVRKNTKFELNNEKELQDKESLVQYIIVRSDLGRNQDRAFNTLISHTSSASTAAIHLFYNHEHTKAYLKNGDNMRKKIFQVDCEEDLLELDIKLMIHKIDYRMWIKQPEKYATCIATRPYPNSELAEHFKSLKVYKK